MIHGQTNLQSGNYGGKSSYHIFLGKQNNLGGLVGLRFLPLSWLRLSFRLI